MSQLALLRVDYDDGDHDGDGDDDGDDDGYGDDDDGIWGTGAKAAHRNRQPSTETGKCAGSPSVYRSRRPDSTKSSYSIREVPSVRALNGGCLLLLAPPDVSVGRAGRFA